MENKYYIGLDCGTNSAGWAVTGESYKLIKKAGKTMWGTRIFDEAIPAEKRRLARSARRRNGRKKARLSLLREIFNSEISKVDEGFFARLDESQFWQADKHENTKYSLFSTEEFTDFTYYKKYPTIYHLKSALAKGDTPDDIRLLFLGINHIIKHRGHFLFAGMDSLGNSDDKETADFKQIWSQTQNMVLDILNVDLDCQDIQQLETILSEKKSKTYKKAALKNIFPHASKEEQAIIDLLSGAVVAADKIINIDDQEENKLPKISFSDDTFDNEEKCEILEKNYTDEFNAFLQLKALYDFGVLKNILKGYNFYSDSKVATYEKHKQDLALLKRVIKQNAPQEYANLFRNVSEKNANYSSYVGYCKVAGKKNKQVKICKPDDFFAKVKKIFSEIECNEKEEILNEIEAGTFLPKQTNKENSVVPNQVHLKELRAILKNNKDKFSFLTLTDESGYSNEEKIEKLLTFRIPYYVGPLNNAHEKNGFAWIVKKEGSITPWNFEEKVDKEACAEKFIENLTATCTYLKGETVLPKNSILYSRFMVLNELNNLKIYEEPISVSQKQQIFNTLMMEKKKVTKKALHQWFVQNGILEKNDDDAISGIDTEMTTSRAIEIDLAKIWDGANPSLEIQEKCIKSIMCLGNEQEILKKRLSSIIPSATSAQISKLAALKLSGWGRLSAKLLNSEKVCSVVDDSGEVMSILDAMYNTNYNFMQLYSEAFGFKAAIDKFNGAILTDEKISYETIADLYTAPSIKRSIWQSYSLVKEIEKIMGNPPKKIFIEMARGTNKDEKGKKKSSRKESLELLYKSIMKEKDEWWAAISADKSRNWTEELNNRDAARFRSDKLYLYYTQMGRCMYTGEAIDLNDLLNNDKNYDIDHIWPQARIKDDSLENRVLVTRIANQEKGSEYPLNIDVRTKRYVFWKALYEKGFIGKKKWQRLIRSTTFSDEELAGFINRQLVETRQSTKELGKILEAAFKDTETEIVYVKAGNVSDFRQLFDIVKFRELNDLHHAKDAYLNIVVGNVYNAKFTNSPIRFIKEEQKKAKFEYSMKPENIFGRNVQRGEHIAWQVGKQGTISMVMNEVSKNNAMVTYQCIQRNSGQNGGFHDQNPVKGKKGLIPLKTSDTRFFKHRKIRRI